MCELAPEECVQFAENLHNQMEHLALALLADKYGWRTPWEGEMKYPKKLQIKPSKSQLGKFAIAVWDTLKKPGDVYHAKNAEELLVFLMGVYGWYPEGVATHFDPEKPIWENMGLDGPPKPEEIEIDYGPELRGNPGEEK